ncbi:MAG: hypothetical protein IIB77_01310 [Proteobacteria bacterium]|nr:hypothetical protein [Pseudomonadota bacterium]
MRLITAVYWVVLFALFSTPAFAACPPIEDGVLRLPADKKWAETDFNAKAKRLNDSGLCVIEGSWGSTMKKFYITVSKTGNIREAKILRFTAAELKK